MKKRRYSRDFKLSILQQIEAGKSIAEVSREHSINPTMICKWKKRYNENPEMAFSGNGNISTLEVKIGKLERTIGQLYLENAFLKKVLENLQTRLQEERKRGGQS
jgi:transposase